jgi:hypothetical protein
MFLMSRFIIGVGLVFCNSYSPMLIGELAHPKDRQVITSLYQTTWYVGKHFMVLSSYEQRKLTK